MTATLVKWRVGRMAPEIAHEAWQLFTRRDQAELIFSTFPEAA